MTMARIKIKVDEGLLTRLQKVAGAGGYSSVEEFVIHVISREMDRLDSDDSESEEEIRKKLEGLGYLT